MGKRPTSSGGRQPRPADRICSPLAPPTTSGQCESSNKSAGPKIGQSSRSVTGSGSAPGLAFTTHTAALPMKTNTKPLLSNQRRRRLCRLLSASLRLLSSGVCGVSLAGQKHENTQRNQQHKTARHFSYTCLEQPVDAGAGAAIDQHHQMIAGRRHGAAGHQPGALPAVSQHLLGGGARHSWRKMPAKMASPDAQLDGETHKVATGCSGKRDPTEFVPLKSFTDANLLSDYRFLESVDHSLDRVMRLRQSLCTPVGGGGSGARGPSKQQRELQAFCRASRGIELVFMPAGMSRRRCNRSHLRQAGRRNSQSGSAPAVHWTVEARFPTGRKFASAPDTSRLSEILQRWRHLWPSQQPDCSLCRLDQGDKLCPIDCNQSLADLLRGTTVVEFPVYVKQQNIKMPCPDARNKNGKVITMATSLPTLGQLLPSTNIEIFLERLEQYFICKESTKQAKLHMLQEERMAPTVEGACDTQVPIFAVRPTGSNAGPTVMLLVNGQECQFVIDTGSAVTLMPQQLQQKLLFLSYNWLHRPQFCEPSPMNAFIAARPSHSLRPAQRPAQLPLLVVDKGDTALLGRDWLAHLRLDWPTIMAQVHAVGTAPSQLLIGRRLRSRLDPPDTIVDFGHATATAASASAAAASAPVPAWRSCALPRFQHCCSCRRKQPLAEEGVIVNAGKSQLHSRFWARGVQARHTDQLLAAPAGLTSRIAAQPGRGLRAPDAGGTPASPQADTADSANEAPRRYPTRVRAPPDRFDAAVVKREADRDLPVDLLPSGDRSSAIGHPAAKLVKGQELC
uniref:Peptidase A2 domain-containing protein n=1 Tax=Macrostomum lignano TaxID=282301 RepID=A0A1I8IRI0_9PLAT